MNKYLIMMLSVCMFLSSPLMAGQAVDQAQAEAIALVTEPGKVVEIDAKTFSTGRVYEFEIQKNNGTVMEIEVDGNNGDIIEHKIDTLSPDVKLPHASISQNEAKAIAQDHVRAITKTGTSPMVKQEKYTLLNGRPCYEIDVRSNLKEYEVYVDANSGAVISTKEDDTGSEIYPSKEDD